MATLFTVMPRRCHCGDSRVDTSDTVSVTWPAVAVHGLYHCFAYVRIREAA